MTLLCVFVQITTFSSLLTRSDVHVVAHALGLHSDRILLLSLHQFDTEVSFCSTIRYQLLRNQQQGCLFWVYLLIFF